MKHYLCYLLAAMITFSSCTKESVTPDTPISPVPDAITGKWLHGSFAMASFWGYDGSYQGNPFEQSEAFNFSKDGHCEFFYVGRIKDYSCTTDGFTYKKGTVVFNDNNSFTFYPTEGTYRGFYSCAPNRNFNRKASQDELKPDTYYYSFETVGNIKYFVIRFNPTDQSGSYFKATSW